MVSALFNVFDGNNNWLPQHSTFLGLPLVYDMRVFSLYRCVVVYIISIEILFRFLFFSLPAYSTVLTPDSLAFESIQFCLYDFDNGLQK